MIRGNWSLAAELKKNERKQQNKVYERQKEELKGQRLKDANPIRIYHQIKKLENDHTKSDKDVQYLTKLKDDWDYIIKHKLHHEKVEPFLRRLEENEKQRLVNEAKLWGSQSIYFNPELNPLGKVPVIEGEQPYPNLTKPLKGQFFKKPELDPLVARLNVVLPKGSPPRFYKLVQNTSKVITKPVATTKASNGAGSDEQVATAKVTNNERVSEDSDNDDANDDNEDDGYDDEDDLAPEEQDYLERMSKKQKLQ